MERLHKYMSRQGLASRRACEDIIASGKVKVDGKMVTTPGTLVDPARVRVEVDGKRLAAAEQKVYILLNKPRGYLSTVKDPRGRKIVTDLLNDIKERVYPVGRLDYDSEGLLLLTNDGDLAYCLTHPGHSVPKTYMVRVKGMPSRKELETLAAGVMLEDGVTAPAQVTLIDQYEGNALLEITISEGRNRQIRRMLEKVGHEVIRLRRTRVGSLSLGDLKSGQYRHLKDDEVQGLYKKFGMKKEKDRLKAEKTRPQREKYGAGKDYSRPKKEKAGQVKDYSPAKKDSRPGKNYSPAKKDSRPGKDYSPANKDNARPGKDYSPAKKDSRPGKDYSPGNKDNARPGKDYSPAKKDSRPGKDYLASKKDNARPGKAYSGTKKESSRGRNNNFGKGGIIKKSI